MKKTILIIIVLYSLLVVAAGCADKDKSRPGENTASWNEKSADVDLTLLSSTMVYAEVSNMLMTPDKYMGKSVRMSGLYNTSYSSETKTRYHFVVIEDSTACCAQGLEFIWSGKHAYPGDYPDKDTKIEIAGVFGSYEELGGTYYYLEVDSILELE